MSSRNRVFLSYIELRSPSLRMIPVYIRVGAGVGNGVNTFFGIGRNGDYFIRLIVPIFCIIVCTIVIRYFNTRIYRYRIFFTTILAIVNGSVSIIMLVVIYDSHRNLTGIFGHCVVNRILAQLNIVIAEVRAIRNLPFALILIPILHGAVIEDDGIESLVGRNIGVVGVNIGIRIGRTVAVLRNLEDIGVVGVCYPVAIFVGNVNGSVPHYDTLTGIFCRQLVRDVEGEARSSERVMRRFSPSITT